MNSPKKKTFNEQPQTIPEVERRFSVVTKFTTNVEANLTGAKHLRQSIRQPAFSGKLLSPHSIYAFQAEPEGKEIDYSGR